MSDRDRHRRRRPAEGFGRCSRTAHPPLARRLKPSPRWPFAPSYVNPEQMTAEKAEYARKGIARGKSIVTLEFEGGVLMVAENPLKLQKTGEIYDRIAFAGVGKFSEFDRLRKMGIQWADVEGYRFSRDDVRGKAMANLYSQILGEEFTRSIKPFEVEIVVAEVGDENLAGHEKNAIYKIGFDGTIQDQRASS